MESVIETKTFVKEKFCPKRAVWKNRDKEVCPCDNKDMRLQMYFDCMWRMNMPDAQCPFGNRSITECERCFIPCAVRLGKKAGKLK